MEIKNINEEDFFGNVKPGARVHYLNPQGQTRSGTVVINKGTHLVLNAGGRHGQPAVVTPKNYVKHSQGGKVQGALLSNLAKSMKSEAHNLPRPGNDEIKDMGTPPGKAEFPRMPELEKQFLTKQQKVNAIKRKFGYGPVTPVKEDAEEINEISKKTKDSYVAKRGSQLSSFLYGRKQDMTGRQQKNAVYGLKRATGKPVGLQAIASFAKEDAQLDAQKSALAYTTKMQKKKKKRTLKTMKEDLLSELSGETLSRYVTKAIADRKGQANMADMAHRIHTPERAKYFANKAAAKIAKRSAGIKTAVGKIASNLPSEPLAAHAAGEKSKHGGWSGMGEAFKRGDKVRLKSVWADPGQENEVFTVKHPHPSSEGRHWISDKEGRGYYAWNHQLRTARTWKKDYSKTNEGRESEYRANQQMAGTTPRRQPGHYLTRDGRTLSGPHSPSDAVRKYKDMSDSRNVKIVHIKEAASKEKAKKAVEKAIAFGKNAKKKGKTANVEPELTVPSASMSQPVLQGSEGAPQNVRI